ncbi:o-spanin [Escherichia phage FritzHoffmann]|nr:o-spanin [Escherichia phage FritzHoffmann]
MRKTLSNVSTDLVLNLWLPILIIIVLLMTGCTTKSQPSVSTSVTLPALSPTARQPPRSPVCSPSCIQKASQNTDKWQKRLKSIVLPASSANYNMMQCEIRVNKIDKLQSPCRVA